MKRTFFIAGVQFRPRWEIDAAVKQIEISDQLTLVPEPANKFDPNAVQIYYESLIGEDLEKGELATFLGYVPKKFSAEVSAMLEIGAPIICTVDEVNPSAKTYEMIKVTIQIPVDEERKEEVEDKVS